MAAFFIAQANAIVELAPCSHLRLTPSQSRLCHCKKIEAGGLALPRPRFLPQIFIIVGLLHFPTRCITPGSSYLSQ